VLCFHPVYHRHSRYHFSFGRPCRLEPHGDFLVIRLPEVVAKVCSNWHEFSVPDPKVQLSAW
jgi:hypothetical protein